MYKLRKTEITDEMLLSSSVPEDDHPEWISGQSYAVGTYVIRTATHRIYYLTGTNSTTPPEDDPTNWNDEGPTNRWAMFDKKVSTVTEQADSITIQLQPGRMDSLALLGVECNDITVDLSVQGESVFNATYSLIDPNANVGDWSDYMFEPVEQSVYDLSIKKLVDLTLENVATYGEGTLTVTLSAPNETVKLGMLVVGMVYFVGKTQNEPDLGINNFTVRSMDEFGDITESRRPAGKDLKCDVEIETDRLDAVFYELFRSKDDDAVWIPTDLHGSMVIYGHATWRIKRKNSKTTIVSMQIKGTT